MKIFISILLLISGALIGVLASGAGGAHAGGSGGPYAGVSTTPRIEEDDPRWDCRTMGNHQCGSSSTPSTSPVHHHAGITHCTPQSCGMAKMSSDPIKMNKVVKVWDGEAIWYQKVKNLTLISCNATRSLCKVLDVIRQDTGYADGYSIYAN